MNHLDPFSQNYLTLVLEIEKHIEGYIDAYLGPSELKTAIFAQEKKSPPQLLEDWAWLQAHIPREDTPRQNFLRATLRAIETTLRILNGESFDYLEEVHRLYDIQPQKTDEAHFLAAHRELDTLLPGSEPLAERIHARQRHFFLPLEKVMGLIEVAKAECRHRTLALVPLPKDETIETTLVKNQPWGAYNWYLGNGRSRIEFNTDSPISALTLANTFAHEAYPGHHTEGLLKEQLFWQERGYGEAAAYLLHSPAAVISEGIATQALEVIFPHDSHYEWNAENVVKRAGILPEPTAQTQRIAQASRALAYVSGNAAILYHTGQLNRQQTIDYIQTYALSSPQRANKSFSFLSHPLYRSYIFTYTAGYDLIERAHTDKTALFRRLLTETILPSQLA